ncbi:MAG: WYL domain-containing protein, partial [Acidimicrobiia bacterium]|nr:WYL domain-containing protein [Acidimicrobiia bacterium]
TLNLLIYLLESPRPVTANEVRNTVAGYGEQSDEAFHRMFERDKDVLRSLGVPIRREALDGWEVDYGYTVDPEEYAIPDPGLTHEERVALSMAARIVRLGGSNAGVDALLKLGGVERGAGLEPLGADLGAEGDVLGDLFGALMERRVVEFEYRGHPRSVKPYGMSHQRGHWYLVGAVPEGERIYRVDRIQKLQVGAERQAFRKPRRFDVREVMATHPWETGGDEAVTATVRFDSDVAWWAARTLKLAEPHGELVAEVPVANHDAFIGWVLSFGSSAEVLSPSSIRESIKERVEEALGGKT